jgi:hypothetical protein
VCDVVGDDLVELDVGTGELVGCLEVEESVALSVFAIVLCKDDVRVDWGSCVDIVLVS